MTALTQVFGSRNTAGELFQITFRISASFSTKSLPRAGPLPHAKHPSLQPAAITRLTLLFPGILILGSTTSSWHCYALQVLQMSVRPCRFRCRPNFFVGRSLNVILRFSRVSVSEFPDVDIHCPAPSRPRFLCIPI